MKVLFNTLSIGAFLLGLFCLLLVLNDNRGANAQLAYIDNLQLYNGFKLKQELEARLNHISNQRTIILDSLKVELDRTSLQLNQSKSEELLNHYRQQLDVYRTKNEEFNNDNQALQSDYNDQIWGQLNQYVQDYGNEHNYTFIFGSSGNGNIMHAKETANLTEEVLAFVNAKYQASL